MHPALMNTVGDDRINELRSEHRLARVAEDESDRERAANQPGAHRGGLLWLRRTGTVFGAFVVLALLAPAALALPVASDRETVGTGTLAQLGNPTNIASGASQGYISRVGKESRETVGTGTLAQLGNPTNIASGASQGYISRVGKEPRVEPEAPIESSTPELWLWVVALAALTTGAGAVALGMMHRHRQSVATV